MKKHLSIVALVLALGGMSVSAQALKVGTVDMKKVFEGYYKTKDAEAKITDARNAAKQELDARMEAYNKVITEAKKLNEEIDKPELSKENKEQKSKARDEKVGELKAMERDIAEFRATREKQLQEQQVLMRGGIVEEINKVVAEKVKSDNYHVVLDKSGPSLNGVPLVLFAKDEFDFTSDVLAALNKSKGKEEAAPSKPAEAAPGKKK
jgi:outer membrane protein